MSVHKLDPISKAYFLQEGREIGFIRECINRTSIKDKAIEAEFGVQKWDKLAFEGTTAKVYAIPRSSLTAFSADESGTDDDVNSKPCDGYEIPTDEPDMAVANRRDTEYPDLIFAAEWTSALTPDTESSDDDCSTYVFVSEPDTETLKRAYSIQKLKHELCFGDFEPTFVCAECGERTHWLVTPRKRVDPLRVSADIKYESVKHRVCGRESSLADRSMPDIDGSRL